ncbi:alpha/beta fold hydrolase [Catellatospora sp. KI3]|uniref:alpha/beta fold hydrolase n=1 Tax=Catellatospora sp. KI3 TaxID=3041620 RepID=UPI002482E480|nr:alpha/beta fold hydrolase [Catellatospora sp. KI3]MDI1464993.1 alpha/beta fold hydrolase [Catellatospora sp. KI3]
MNISQSETLFLDIPGGRLSYDLTGPADGPLVVCLPGMGDLRSAYRFTTARLAAAGYRVAQLDVRGHGESSTGWGRYGSDACAEDALALIAHLGGPAVVVGHSATTASAIRAAASAPDRVTAIVLIAGFLNEVELNPVLKLAVAAVTRSALLWTRGFYAGLYKAAKPEDFPAYLRRLQANMGEPGRLAALRGLLADAREGNAAIPGVTCPTLIVMGTADPDFPDPAAEARAQEQALGPYASAVRVRLLDGAGHYPHAELPEQTAAAITGFLAEVVRA